MAYYYAMFGNVGTFFLDIAMKILYCLLYCTVASSLCMQSYELLRYPDKDIKIYADGHTHTIFNYPKKIIKPSVKKRLKKFAWRKQTALIDRAIQLDNVPLLKAALLGKEINKVYAASPLHQAALWQSVEVLQFLLQCKNMNPNSYRYGTYPLFYGLDDKNVIKMLVRYGADVAAKNQDGNPLIHQVIQCGTLPMLRNLLQYTQVDVLQRNSKGLTAAGFAHNLLQDDSFCNLDRIEMYDCIYKSLSENSNESKIVNSRCQLAKSQK